MYHIWPGSTHNIYRTFAVLLNLEFYLKLNYV